jgi:hypothetical protein
MKHLEKQRPSHRSSLLRDLRELAATAQLFYKHGGVRALPFLFFSHIGYIPQDKIQNNDDSDVKLVKNESLVPSGAKITGNLKNDQYAGYRPFRSSIQDNWSVYVHSDGRVNVRIGYGSWPVIEKEIPLSAKLTREQAEQQAINLFTGE